MHEGHRNRMRDKLLSGGIENFKEHEIIEVLLYYCIPRQNTNEIAHALLEQFGSLRGVLDANADELQKVPGIGPNAAVFLTMLPQVLRRYELERFEKRPLLGDSTSSSLFVYELLKGLPEERCVSLYLDTRSRLIHYEILGSGIANQVGIQSRKVLEGAMRHRAVSVIIAHNHPGGSRTPSSGDLAVTYDVMNTLSAGGVRLLDHLIVTNEGVTSLENLGLLKEKDPQKTKEIAEVYEILNKTAFDGGKGKDDKEVAKLRDLLQDKQRILRKINGEE